MIIESGSKTSVSMAQSVSCSGAASGVSSASKMKPSHGEVLSKKSSGTLENKAGVFIFAGAKNFVRLPYCMLRSPGVKLLNDYS
jgi:hypothetical protein